MFSIAFSAVTLILLTALGNVRGTLNVRSVSMTSTSKEGRAWPSHSAPTLNVPVSLNVMSIYSPAPISVLVVSGSIMV